MYIISADADISYRKEIEIICFIISNYRYFTYYLTVIRLRLQMTKHILLGHIRVGGQELKKRYQRFSTHCPSAIPK